MSVGQYAKIDMDTTIPIGPTLDLEKEFVNHLATTKGAEYAIRDGVATEILYVPKNRGIFAFVQSYFNQTGEFPTEVVLKEEFNIQAQPVQTTIEWVIDKLRERYQRNQIQDLILDLSHKADSPSDALDLITAKTFEIQKNSTSQKYIWSAGDSKLFLNNLQEKVLQGHYKGAPIGFDAIDKFTGGLKKSYLAFLLARPKRQKTFFICNTFIKQKLAGFKPMLVTMENTDEEIKLRISCLLSGYPWDKAQRGEFSSAAWKLLENTWDEFDALGDHWIVSPPDEERTVPQISMMADKLGADSLIISQFAYLHPTNSQYYSRPDHEKWGSIVLDLKNAANRKGYERPILVEAQLNREGDRIEDFSEMSLSQLGLTDRIGQVSDIVFALYQNKEMRDNQQIQFGIVEARNSDKSSWYVRTEFKNETFLEIT